MKYTIAVLLFGFAAVALAKEEAKKVDDKKTEIKTEEEPHKGAEKAEFFSFGKPKHQQPGGLGQQQPMQGQQQNGFPQLGQPGVNNGLGQGQGQIGQQTPFGQNQNGQQGQWGQNQNKPWEHHPRNQWGRHNPNNQGSNENGFNNQNGNGGFGQNGNGFGQNGNGGLGQGWNPNQQNIPGQQQQQQGGLGQGWNSNQQNIPGQQQQQQGVNGGFGQGLGQGWNTNQQNIPSQQQGYPFQQPGNGLSNNQQPLGQSPPFNPNGVQNNGGIFGQLGQPQPVG